MFSGFWLERAWLDDRLWLLPMNRSLTCILMAALGAAGLAASSPASPVAEKDILVGVNYFAGWKKTNRHHKSVAN